MNDDYIIINSDEIPLPEVTNNLWENRLSSYKRYDMSGIPKCSVIILANNRIMKTKYCVECVLKYTHGIDYELILIDSGSNDGTLDFFQSVEHNNKIIIKITKNISFFYAMSVAKDIYKGQYFVLVPNDVYVTQNWLTNLLACYESDSRIGFAVPVCSNVSNLQQVDLSFQNFDQMQRMAAEYNNRSNPQKWEERMRLMSVVTILSRPVIDIVGIFDAAYVHDFSEDDLAARLRRSGYKLILCKDTWVCHDHDYRNLEDKDPSVFHASIETGRNFFREKHNGIDAWDDINNYEAKLLAPIDNIELKNNDGLNVLTVEPRCGTPILEIRNRLSRRGFQKPTIYAFTTKAKYYSDLHYAADYVNCDRIDFIQSSYFSIKFDIIACCEPINHFPTPYKLLQRLYDHLKPEGLLLLKLRNIDGYNTFLRTSGLGGVYEPDMPTELTVNDLFERLKLLGGQDITASTEPYNINEADVKTLVKLLEKIKPEADTYDITRFITKDYIFKVMKK